MEKIVPEKYIMTSHINQDYVENRFGIIRGLGGFNMKPNQVDVIHRVKKLVVGQRFNQAMGCNVISNEDNHFLTFKSLRALMSNPDEVKFPLRNPIVNDSMFHDKKYFGGLYASRSKIN